MCAWDVTFETDATALVARITGGGDGVLEAWRALMVRVAPHIEGWVRGSRVLRRCRLAGVDDVRAVLVDVFERLAADDYANLKRFATREALASADDADPLVGELVQLGKLEDDPEAAAPAGETPLRAWMISLVNFAAHDHARRRLGWATADGPTKRAVSTDASPLDGAPEPAARPPMTDRLSVAKLVEEIRAFMATFPDDMQRALALWLAELEPAEIAERLALPDVARARALVRAGQARLRERFRGRSPLLFA